MFLTAWSSLWEPSALWFWEIVEVVGAVIVTLGVVGEYISNFTKLIKGRSRKQRWEKRSTLVLIFGLAVELVGLVTTLSLSNIEVQRLLANNLELQAKLNPRMITPEQKANFMILTSRIKKIPISIYASTYGDDTESFSFQLRNMLTEAGFGLTPNTNPLGIKNDVTISIARPITTTAKPPWVFIYSYHTNDFLDPMPGTALVGKIGTNTVKIPVVTSEDQEQIYRSISLCLNQIGIPTDWTRSTNNMAPGQWELYVPPKNF